LPHADVRDESEPCNEIPSEPRARILGKRILVVDDQDDVRATIVATLSSAGAELSEATSGDEALRMLGSSEEPFDLMCIDGIMPGTSTAEVIKQVRTSHPDTKILLCSGYVEEELLRRGVATGETAFLPKPFDATQLLTAVRELLQPPQRTSLMSDPHA
jgi:CheY-like chemotaxis protein